MLRRLKALLPRSLKRSVTRLYRNIQESFAYQLAKPAGAPHRITHVVFVCKGNICRSAFAEYYLRSILDEGHENIRIESCGLDVDQGFVSPPEAVQAAREFGLDLTGHRSKGAAACDLRNADLIVPMEYGHYRRLLALYPQYKDKIRLLRDFAPWPQRIFCNIHDPYGLGLKEFRRCFRMIHFSLDGLRDRRAATIKINKGAFKTSNDNN